MSNDHFSFFYLFIIILRAKYYQPHVLAPKSEVRKLNCISILINNIIINYYLIARRLRAVAGAFFAYDTALVVAAASGRDE